MNRQKHTDNSARGFTRGELIVVAVVLALGLLFFLPAISERGHRTQSMMYVDNSHLRQIGISLYAYSVDHDGGYPAHPKDLASYLPDPPGEVFFSPFQKERGELGPGRVDGPLLRYGSYVFVNLGVGLNEVKDPGTHVVAYTARVSSKQTKRSVLFTDFHVDLWEDERILAALPEGIDLDALDGP